MSCGPYIYEELAQLQDQNRNVSHAQGLSIGRGFQNQRGLLSLC